MLIDQLVARDFSTIQFAERKSAESIAESDSGFAAYLARVMDADSSYESAARRAGATGTVSRRETEDIGAPQDAEAQKSSGAEPPVNSEQKSAKSKPTDTESRSGSDVSPKSANDEGAAGGVSGAEPSETAKSEETAGKTKSQNGVAVKRRSEEQNPTVLRNRANLNRAQESEAADHEVAASVQKAMKPAFSTAATSSDSMLQAETADIVAKKSPAVTQQGRVAEIEVLLTGSTSANPKEAGGRRVSGENSRFRRAAEGAASKGAHSREAGDDGAEEAAGSRTGTTKTRVQVRDLRPNPVRSESSETAEAGRSQVGQTQEPAGDQQARSNEPGFNSLVADRLSDASSGRAMSSSAAKRSAPALTTLRQALNDQLNGEIVRAAKMIVRGQDTGEIRLHLRPESLGNVRIRLEMHEGHIAGRIIVENSSVREVFEQNLGSLLRAFNESGLETGAMDIMLSDSGGRETSPDARQGSAAGVRELDQAVPLVQSLDDDHELVDLVV